MLGKVCLNRLLKFSEWEILGQIYIHIQNFPLANRNPFTNPVSFSSSIFDTSLGLMSGTRDASTDFPGSEPPPASCGNKICVSLAISGLVACDRRKWSTNIWRTFSASSRVSSRRLVKDFCLFLSDVHGAVGEERYLLVRKVACESKVSHGEL